MPSVFSTTTKSTPVWIRTDCAFGWRMAVGSGLCSAATMPGEFAKVCATATERFLASSTLSRLDCTTSATTAAATSSSTTST